MKKLVLFFSFTILGTIAALAQSVGSIDGVFDVSNLGAATYVIPLKVPSGVNGMQPSLTLSYNSNSGNGLMGMGWSLSGLSAITRDTIPFITTVK